LDFFRLLVYTKRNPKLDKWGTFVEKVKTLLENVQELIIKKTTWGNGNVVYKITNTEN
jgi:hypothetical protein